MIAEFPWQALPRVSADEARASRVAARAFGPGLRAQAATALSELLGQRASIERRRRALTPIGRLDLGARGAVVVLETAVGPLALEVDAELALAVVGALAGRKSLPKIARDRAIPPEVAGALAGVALWLARTCGLEADLDADGPKGTEDARAALSRAGGLAARALVLDVTVSVGALRGGARVAWAPLPLVSTAKTPALTVLRALGETPLSLPVVLGAGWLPAREAARVGLGDLFVVDTPSADTQRVVLASGGADFGVSAERIDGGARLCIGARRVGLAPEPTSVERGSGRSDGSASLANSTGGGGTGSDATVEIAALDDGGPLVEALADAPVMIRVELGAVTLPARDWAAMGVGDVVTLDRRVGEAVQLRVGGRLVARGELVDVDGAIGVRVLERLP